MEIKCKCGSTNVFLENKGSQVGIYCSACGKWIKWATKEEARVIKHNEETIASGSISDYHVSISMADHNERLKADMKAILEDIDLEVDELTSHYADRNLITRYQVHKLIQQRIDKI